MRLTDNFKHDGTMIDYMLDTGDGEFSYNPMPSTVALEIVERAKGKALTTDPEGRRWLVINGRQWFPFDAFDAEGESIPELKRGAKPRKGGRPTKSELLEEAGKAMTNPQLHEAIEGARRAKASRRSKATDAIPEE